jgi:DNA-3-methyladenine glycosylase
MTDAPLPRSFFARDSATVARALVGQRLVRRFDEGVVVARITEVEAYCGPLDTASHARHGKTSRNAPIWGAPGHVYMYLCYGIHMMLNLVAGSEGSGQAILVRAAEVLEGEALVVERRSVPMATPELLAGPGRLAQGLALDLAFNFHDVCAPGALEVRAGEPVDVVVGPRVGVDYADARDRKAPLRFGLAGSRAVTKRALLKKR